MHRIAIAIAVLLGILAVQPEAVRAQTAQPTPATQGKRIAHLTTGATHPFIAALSKAFTDRAAEYGMSVTVFSSPFDAALQAQQLDQAIAQKFDLLAVLAASEQAIIPPLTRAKQAGVPVILVNTPPKEGADDNLFVSFIGENHTDLGRIAGESVLKAFQEGGRDGGKVALVTGSLHEGVAPKRVAGFREVLAKNPKIQVVAVEDAKWDTATSERISGQLYARFAAQGGLDAIYGMADNQAMAAIQAAEAANIKIGVKKGELLVVGSNCLKPTIGLIRAGKLYSSATQLPVRTARNSVDRIADFFNGKKLERNIIQPVEVINRENVDKWEVACTF